MAAQQQPRPACVPLSRHQSSSVANSVAGLMPENNNVPHSMFAHFIQNDDGCTKDALESINAVTLLSFRWLNLKHSFPLVALCGHLYTVSSHLHIFFGCQATEQG